jgi:alpha-mannosidase
MKKLFIGLLMLSSLGVAATPQPLALRPNGSSGIWLVALPLPNDQVATVGKTCSGFYTDYLTAAGGENKAQPGEGDRILVQSGQSIAWQPAFTDSMGTIDFMEVLGRKHDGYAVAYAFCTISSPTNRKAVIKVGSDDAVRVWLNQDLVHDHHIHRGLHLNEDVVPVTLNKGENRLLVKIDQGSGDWGFNLIIVDEKNQPIPSLNTVVNLAQPLRSQLISAKLMPYSLVGQTSQGPRQKARLEIVSNGLKNVICRIAKPDWPEPVIIKFGALPVGKCYRNIWLPIVQTTGPVQAVLEAGKDKYIIQDAVLPLVKPWTVYLVQHVHTDIGYTRPQTEILPEHLRYIDYALDFCDLTDSYPEDSKFRWTCEISWAVREYIKYRPQRQIDRLKKRIAEGRIEVTAMFLNMSDIADETILAASLQPLAECKRVLNAPIVTAMQNDVNGMAWCLTDYFSDAGIKYVSMGINETRSLLPFDKPTAFWWESPSGKRVLAWRPDHYHTGNFFEIHQAKLDLFEPLVLNYLAGLEKKGYPFDRVAVQFSGYRTDNSPPAMVECDLVKSWNEKYVYPKMRMATAHEFLDYIAANHGEQLAVHRQAWPDWWTDGFGSAARETAVTREMQKTMQVNQGLLSMAQLLGAALPTGIAERITAANDALLFYDEHTFGAAESISDPMAENSMVQWGEKSSYAWEGVKRATMLQEECLGLLQDKMPRTQAPTIAVFNTLNWPRSGLIKVFIDHEMLPMGKDFRIVDAQTGENTPAQLLSSRSEGSYWAIWAQKVPALGYKCYRIITLDQEKPVSFMEKNTQPVLENGYYRLEIDPHTGAIASWLDKQGNIELVDHNGPWQLGQYIYEKLDGSRDTFKGKFDRSSLHNIAVKKLADGPVWKSLLITGDAQGLAENGGFSCEVRLYEPEKRIELLYSARKQPVTDPEAVYVAFPFAMNNSRIFYESQGGTVIPGTGQLPRSASDWQAIQNYAVVQGDEGQIVWSSVGIPLVQLGDINLGKWMNVTQVDKPHIYSWVMNNYWFTNFLAKQEGEMRWRYELVSQKEKDASAAARFGWSSAVPLATRVLTPGSASSQPASFSGFAAMPANILVVSARPDWTGHGIVLCLRETGGQKASVSLAGLLPEKRLSKATLVNALDESLQPVAGELTLTPFESKMLKLEWH